VNEADRLHGAKKNIQTIARRVGMATFNITTMHQDGKLKVIQKKKRHDISRHKILSFYELDQARQEEEKQASD
jgi:hypothetical protein